jgi:hypothetical protein
MSKHSCGTDLELKKFDTFSYWYCPSCKLEAADPEQTKEISLFDTTDWTRDLSQAEIDKLWDEWLTSQGRKLPKLEVKPGRAKYASSLEEAVVKAMRRQKVKEVLGEYDYGKDKRLVDSSDDSYYSGLAVRFIPKWGAVTGRAVRQAESKDQVTISYYTRKGEGK